MASGALLDPSNVRIAFVQSSWHKDLVDQTWRAFVDGVGEAGVTAGHVERFEVTGAFEIPLHAKRLAESGRFDAIVGAGLVVDGGIYRHEFVASAVIDGLMRVQLDTGVPVLSCVLTPHHFHEHPEHVNYFSRHLAIKGTEAARACVETIASLQRLPTAEGHAQR
jgi:6,7-dimethyl-8-ribityllumazine synthase